MSIFLNTRPNMNLKLRTLTILFSLLLLSARFASAQDIQTNVTYLCSGERITIDSCNIRDTSDTSTCMVGHPDRILANGIMAYTTETRGSLKKRLPACTQPSAAELAKAKAFNKKVEDKQDAAQKKAEADLDAQEAQFNAQVAARANPQAKPMSQDQRELNRCITAGRLPSVCEGGTLMKPFGEIVASVLPSVGAPLRPGSNMAGNFEGRGRWRIEFDDRSVMLACADLTLQQHPYKLALQNNRVVITIDMTPIPLVLTYRSDGALAGPGPVTVDGRIYLGRSEGVTVDGVQNVNVDTYREATRHCEQPILSSKGVSASTTEFASNALTSMFSDGQKAPPTPPGLRMHGTFAAQSGMGLEFFPETVIISCGEPARAYPYSVQSDGAHTAVKINDPDHAVLLSLQPDGQLDISSAPYEVHGRRITGQDENGDFTFAPLNATCNLGPFKPGPIPSSAAATASVASAAPSGSSAALPSATVGNAVLTIAAHFAPVSLTNTSSPLAGHTFVLLKESFEGVLSHGGFIVPSGTQPYVAMLNACTDHTPDCQKASAAIQAETVAGVRLDAAGKATFTGVRPGTYFLMGSGWINPTSPADRQLLVWNFKVTLRNGASSLVLDQTNATRAK